MEAILKFNLPEDEEDFKMSIDGWKWKAIVDDMDQVLRGIIKHVDMPDNQHEQVVALRDKLHDLINEYDPWQS